MKKFIIIVSIAALLSGCAAVKAVDRHVDVLEDVGVEAVEQLVLQANQLYDAAVAKNARHKMKLDRIGRALGRGR